MMPKKSNKNSMDETLVEDKWKGKAKERLKDA
jgi:hypothetical protein